MDYKRILALILRAVALSMGLCVVVFSQLHLVTVASAFTMLGVGLVCLAVCSLDLFRD